MDAPEDVGAAPFLTLWARRGGPPFLVRVTTSAMLQDATEASLLQGNRYPLRSVSYFLSWLPRTIIRIGFQNNLVGDMLLAPSHLSETVPRPHLTIEPDKGGKRLYHERTVTITDAVRSQGYLRLDLDRAWLREREREIGQTRTH